MSKRDEYYDGEEGDGSCVGLLLIAAMVSALALVLGLAFFSLMAVL